MAAEKKLRKLAKQIVKNPKFVSTMASKKIKWNFQSFLCLTFWWCFEVMIKTAKKAIVAILENLMVPTKS